MSFDTNNQTKKKMAKIAQNQKYPKSDAIKQILYQKCCNEPVLRIRIRKLRVWI
jgi:hypothetical protein